MSLVSSDQVDLFIDCHVGLEQVKSWYFSSVFISVEVGEDDARVDKRMHSWRSLFNE